MTIFKTGDLVEHTSGEGKTLGLVVSNKSVDDILVRPRYSNADYMWKKSQCTVVAREGKWVTTVTVKEDMNFMENFHNVTGQLLDAGVDPVVVAQLSFDYGKMYDGGGMNGKLRQLLEDFGYSVAWS